MAFTLAYVAWTARHADGSETSLATPERRAERHPTLEEAMQRARTLIATPGIAALELFSTDGGIVMGPRDLARALEWLSPPE